MTKDELKLAIKSKLAASAEEIIQLIDETDETSDFDYYTKAEVDKKLSDLLESIRTEITSLVNLEEKEF